MSILSGIASALGNVIQNTVIPGFGNVVVTVKRGTTTRNQANESVLSWADVATGIKMRIDVLSADDVVKAWGATSDAKATGIMSGLDVPNIQPNDILIVTQVLEGVFPTLRWKIEEAPYNDAARMWTMALVPHKSVQPT